MRDKPPLFKHFLFAIFYILYSIFYLEPALAASPLISVSPSIIKLDLEKDLPETILTYTNNTPQSLEINLSAANFSPIRDNGQLAFIDDSSGNSTYSLSTWISFEKNILTLAPQESTSVKIFIEKNKLPIGGHYASILASMNQSTPDSQIKLNTVLSTLLFIRAPGGNEIYDAQIETFALNKTFLNLPSSVVLKIQNTGNSDITPHGKVDILNSRSEIISQAILNQTSLLVLPNSLRRFDTGFNRPQVFSPPGFYKSLLTLGYGAKDVQITREETFFSLGTHPLPFLAPPLLLIVFLGFAKLRRKSH